MAKYETRAALVDRIQKDWAEAQHKHDLELAVVTALPDAVIPSLRLIHTHARANAPAGVALSVHSRENVPGMLELLTPAPLHRVDYGTAWAGTFQPRDYADKRYGHHIKALIPCMPFWYSLEHNDHRSQAEVRWWWQAGPDERYWVICQIENDPGGFAIREIRERSYRGRRGEERGTVTGRHATPNEMLPQGQRAGIYGTLAKDARPRAEVYWTEHDGDLDPAQMLEAAWNFLDCDRVREAARPTW